MEEVIEYVQIELGRELTDDAAQLVVQAIEKGRRDVDELIGQLQTTLDAIDLDDDQIPAWCLELALDKDREEAPPPAPPSPRAEPPGSVKILSKLLKDLRSQTRMLEPNVPLDTYLYHDGHHGWKPYPKSVDWDSIVPIELLWPNRFNFIKDGIIAEGRWHFERGLSMSSGNLGASEDDPEAIPTVIPCEQIIGVEGRRQWIIGILGYDIDIKEWFIEGQTKIYIDLHHAVATDDSYIGEGHVIMLKGVLQKRDQTRSRTGGPSQKENEAVENIVRRHRNSIDQYVEPSADTAGEFDEGPPLVFHVSEACQPLRRFHGLRTTMKNLKRKPPPESLVTRMAEMRALKDNPLVHATWVIINNAKFDWIDRMKVIRGIFDHYELRGVDVSEPTDLWDNLQNPNAIALPIGFILMGNFSLAVKDEVYLPATQFTTINNYESIIDSYLHTWQPFYDLMMTHPRIKQKCQILLVAGPNDPGIPLLPRFELPAALRCYVDSELKGAHVHFVTNPVKVSCMDVTFRVLRDNTATYMKDRNRLWHRPKELEHDIDGGGWDGFVKTVVGQARLVPLPDCFPTVVPVTLPLFDLQLYLLDDLDLLLYGDRLMDFHVTEHEGTIVANVPDVAVYDVVTRTLTPFQWSQL